MSSVPASRTVPGTPQYTEDDIKGFCALFERMPSYRHDDNSISSKDVPTLIKKMNWNRSQEQIDQYVNFWDTNFNGRMPMHLYCNILKAQHDKHKLLQEYATSFDKDKHGYISAEEFKFGLETLLVHDPTLNPVTYKEFVDEADTNKNGKVNIKELTQWLYKIGAEK